MNPHNVSKTDWNSSNYIHTQGTNTFTLLRDSLTQTDIVLQYTVQVT